MDHRLIYMADDEKNIRELIRKALEKEGYQVVTFENGESLLTAFQNKPADLVILDIMMDGIDGMSACCMIRQVSTVPIIIISAKGNEIDKVTAINIGCDDYLTKPFSLLEMTARVNAIFRRLDFSKRSERNKSNLILGELQIDQNLREITLKGKVFNVTPTEFALMEYLVINRHRAVSRDELLRKIWDINNAGITTRATDDAIKRLRGKLTACKANIAIKTVRGFGFTIEEIDTHES